MQLMIDVQPGSLDVVPTNQRSINRLEVGANRRYLKNPALSGGRFLGSY